MTDDIIWLNNNKFIRKMKCYVANQAFERRWVDLTEYSEKNIGIMWGVQTKLQILCIGFYL
jgi:hypothetical protein